MPSILPAPHRLYEHRPKPFSNALTLDLGPRTLLAERGNSKQEYPLAGIEKIRLSYTPANTARLGFSCHFRMKDGKSLRFSSLTWKSMVETGRQDAEYTAFLKEFVTRAAKANPGILLTSGVGALRYRLAQLGGLILLPALIACAVYLALNGVWPIGLLALGLAAWLGFFAREFLSRNRPRHFTPETIPPEVLPR